MENGFLLHRRLKPARSGIKIVTDNEEKVKAEIIVRRNFKPSKRKDESSSANSCGKEIGHSRLAVMLGFPMKHLL